MKFNIEVWFDNNEEVVHYMGVTELDNGPKTVSFWSGNTFISINRSKTQVISTTEIKEN